MQQLFILYVRIAAKKSRNETIVHVCNPLLDSISLRGQNGGVGDDMLKKLATSFLSSKSTAMKYDLKQAANMQGSILGNLAIMWFLHFKMEKIQPLLIHIFTSIVQLIYSPLFQVYVSPLALFQNGLFLHVNKCSTSQLDSGQELGKAVQCRILRTKGINCINK